MSLKHAVMILSILLAAVLVVGLVLCRPMAAGNYASGVFNFGAVSEITASAWVEAPGVTGAEALTVLPESSAFDELVGAFDRRGFGRTVGSIFRDEAPVPGEGDMCWRLTFSCTISQSELTVEYTGGTLRLSGGDAVTVATQDKDEWARSIYDLIVSLYPEPEPEPPEQPESTGQEGQE